MKDERIGETIHARFEQCMQKHPAAAACMRKHRDEWEDISWRDLHQAVRCAAAVFSGWGVGQGTVVGLCAPSRYEWLVCDLAVLACGGATLALPAALPQARGKAWLTRLGLKILIVNDPGGLALWLEDDEPLAPLERLVYFDARQERPGSPPLMLDDVTRWPPSPRVMSLDEVVEEGSYKLAGPAAGSVDPEACAAVVLSQGVAGGERAIHLSHTALLGMAESLSQWLALEASEVQLLGLPLSHVLGRSFYLATLFRGSATAFPCGEAGLCEHLRTLRPAVLVSTGPRLRALSERLLAPADATWLQRTARRLALRPSERAREKVRAQVVGWAQAAVVAPVRRSLGGRLRMVVSAGSAAEGSVFRALGVEVVQAYGLSEAGGVVACRSDQRPATLLGGAEWRLSPEGTAQLSLPMSRFTLSVDEEDTGLHRSHLRPSDGWLETADRLAEGASLPDIWGRSSDWVQLSSGQQVHIGAIERTLMEEALVSLAVLVGEGRPYLTALLSLDPEALRAWQHKGAGSVTPYAEATQDPKVYQHLKALVERYNQQVAPYAHVVKIAIVDKHLLDDTRVMTEFGACRRWVVEGRYQRSIASFYRESF